MQDIIIYGHDPRMDYVAGYFYNLGFDVYEALDDAHLEACVIAAPKLSLQEETKLCECIHKKQTLWYGMLSPDCMRSLEEKQVIGKSYMQLEKLVYENAILTAQGMLRIAGREAVLLESHCLVLGYGYCGKEMARALQEAGAHVDVCVRRKDLKSEILERGFGYRNLLQFERYDFEKYSYVFNTIPAKILTAERLEKFSANIILYDIATKPGGTDFEYCEKRGIRADLYPGIPGNLYPKEAGNIIASCIYEHDFTAEPPA